MFWLRHATASQEVPLGFAVDATDGDTEKTALSIAAADIHIWKTGATATVAKNSGGATHMNNGIYYAVLDATDSSVCGPLVIFLHKTGSRPIVVQCLVLPANVYDSLGLGTDLLGVSVGSMGDQVLTVAATDVGLLSAIAARSRDSLLDELLAGHVVPGSTAEGITLASLAAPVEVPTAQENASAVWDALTTEHDDSGTFGADAGSTLLAQSIADTVLAALRSQGASPGMGEARGGTSTTIQLAADAVLFTSWINKMGIVMMDPQGVAQGLKISDLDLDSKVCTMNGTWNTTPVAGTPYFVVF